MAMLHHATMFNYLQLPAGSLKCCSTAPKIFKKSPAVSPALSTKRGPSAVSTKSPSSVAFLFTASVEAVELSCHVGQVGFLVIPMGEHGIRRIR